VTAPRPPDGQPITPPSPLNFEPRRVRRSYDEPDDQFDHLITSDPTAWRRAPLLDRLAVLAEPLAGLEITPLQHRILESLADSEVHVVGILSALLWRARQAEPLGAAPPDVGDAR
jgi:hypothetical protein